MNLLFHGQQTTLKEVATVTPILAASVAPISPGKEWILALAFAILTCVMAPR